MKQLTVILFFVCVGLQAQRVPTDSAYISTDIAEAGEFGIKNPLKASLYSAVLPGMGQIYNEKYWKAPLVWGLIGTFQKKNK